MNAFRAAGERTRSLRAREGNWIDLGYGYNVTIPVIQERAGSNVSMVAYTRGRDLSGTFEGAGGIGGLLARSSSYSAGSWGAHSMYHADGNGNITYLVSNASAKTGEYRYDPYGRALYTYGPTNPFRFSSKLWHEKTGFYYYGYRFYDPLTQRWINRDPIGEYGGLNLYSYAVNSPIDRLDAFGESPDWDGYNACMDRAKQNFADCLKGPACLLRKTAQGWIDARQLISHLRRLCMQGPIRNLYCLAGALIAGRIANDAAKVGLAAAAGYAAGCSAKYAVQTTACGLGYLQVGIPILP